MKNRESRLLVILAVLAIVSLACGVSKSTPEVESPAAAQPSGAGSVEPTAVPAPTEAPPVEMGDAIRSEAGGYSLQSPKGYTVSEMMGMTSFEAPGAVEEIGPYLLIIGGTSDAPYTADQLREEFTTGQADTTLEIINEQEIKVNGLPGFLVELKGKEKDRDVIARVVAVNVSDTQTFMMLGIAPAESWDQLRVDFDNVLRSVEFFPPTETTEDFGFVETPAASGEQVRQWTFLAWASSQYGEDSWSASQINGEPNTFTCEDSTTAWASSDRTSEDWIYASFLNPVIPTEINIYETYYPGYIVKVYVVSTDGLTEQVVYEAQPAPDATCPTILTISVTGIDFTINSIKIVLDQSSFASGEWSEIDAVELIGTAP